MTRALVTGSAGHLGEAIVRSLRERGYEVAGLDLTAGILELDGTADQLDLSRA